MTPVDWAHAGIVIFLIVVFPIWDWRETRRLREGADPDGRVRSYRKTIVWQIAVVAVLLATIPYAGLFEPPPYPLLDVGTPVAVGIVAGLIVGTAAPALVVLLKPAARDSMQARLAPLSYFLPRTRRERGWFALVCIVVGVCEEIIFRGFLITYFMELPLGLGVPGAALASAAIFGLCHGYQGWSGMALTGALGIAFTVAFFVTGTLWPPIVLHALIDLRLLVILPRPGGVAAPAAGDRS